MTAELSYAEKSNWPVPSDQCNFILNELEQGTHVKEAFKQWEILKGTPEIEVDLSTVNFPTL